MSARPGLPTLWNLWKTNVVLRGFYELVTKPAISLNSGVSYGRYVSMCAEEASIIICRLSNPKLIRLVGRTHANIILALSRPIRVSESYFIQILSFPKLHKEKRVIGQQYCFHLFWVLSLLRWKSTFFWKGLGSLRAGKTSSWKVKNRLGFHGFLND